MYFQLKQYSPEHVFHFQWTFRRILAFLFCIFLMPMNWSIEAMKWKYVNDTNGQYISFNKSMASVIFGACAGFISPGRWGEPFARAYYLDPTHKANTLYSNLAGIISQWIIVLIAGLIAVWYYGILSKETSTSVILILICLFTIVFYLSHDKILDTIFSLKLVNRYVKFKPSNLRVTSKKKVVILLFGIWRFFTFSLQYLILIYAFSFYGVPLDILMKIFLLFLFQSFSLFPSILDLGYKGNLALFLFKNHSILPSELLFIIFFIWFVNLAMPATFGYFVFTNKIKNLLRIENSDLEVFKS